MQPSTGSRLVRLDGLRGLAVLSVVLFHAGHYLVPSLGPELLPGGFIGVDLFFVISGFLMTSILLDPGQGYGRFYLRRVARLFPALYIFLAAQLAYTAAAQGVRLPDLRPYSLIGLGLGNWGRLIGVGTPFSLDQTWSLGVEEQLYLIWPAALVLLGRRNPGRVRKLCIIGIAGSFLAKFLMIRAGVPAVDIYGQTGGRLDEFLVGALVALSWRERPLQGPGRGWLTRAPAVYAAAGFLAFALVAARPYSSRWLYEGGFTAVGLSCGILLSASLHQMSGTGLAEWRPLRSLGRYSYSVYLWHPLVFYAAARAIPGVVLLRVVVAAGVLTAISAASTRLVEEPLRQVMARRISRPPALPPATAPHAPAARAPGWLAAATG